MFSIRKSIWMPLSVVSLMCGVYFYYANPDRSLSDIEQVNLSIEKYEALGVKNPDKSELRRVLFPDRLHLPTMVSRVGEYWFVVDSYNNRVIYSDDLTLSIVDWIVLDDQLSRPHSLAWDGQFLVVDDTDAHAVRIYQFVSGQFILTQTFYGIGARPHRVIYDEESKRFYILASMSQEIVELEVDGDALKLIRKVKVERLGSVYARSFGFVDGQLLVYASNRVVLVLDHRDGSYRELDRYWMPDDFRSLNDLIKVGGVWYATATYGHLGRCLLGADKVFVCEDIVAGLGGSSFFTGNPYYFSVVNGVTYMSVITGSDTGVAFEFNALGDIISREILFSE